MVAKFFIAAMEGQCYVNNGLLLKRIESMYRFQFCLSKYSDENSFMFFQLS